MVHLVFLLLMRFILDFRKDATLKELTGLIKEVHEESRRLDARFSFRTVFHTSFGRWQQKDMGTVYNGRETKDDALALHLTRFQQGDIIDVAIHLGPSGIAPHEMEARQHRD